MKKRRHGLDVKYLDIKDMPNINYLKKGYFLIEDIQAYEQNGIDDEYLAHMIIPHSLRRLPFRISCRIPPSGVK